jgi:hypothetical protein
VLQPRGSQGVARSGSSGHWVAPCSERRRRDTSLSTHRARRSRHRSCDGEGGTERRPTPDPTPSSRVRPDGAEASIRHVTSSKCTRSASTSRGLALEARPSAEARA